MNDNTVVRQTQTKGCVASYVIMTSNSMTLHLIGSSLLQWLKKIQDICTSESYSAFVSHALSTEPVHSLVSNTVPKLHGEKRTQRPQAEQALL
jgi:hypothetical protein